MNNTSVDIKKLSVVEIKALAYDELAKLEACQMNLRTLNQELTLRAEQSTNANVNE
jgi:hypothetical protein